MQIYCSAERFSAVVLVISFLGHTFVLRESSVCLGMVCVPVRMVMETNPVSVLHSADPQARLLGTPQAKKKPKKKQRTPKCNASGDEIDEMVKASATREDNLADKIIEHGARVSIHIMRFVFFCFLFQ